MDSVVKEARPEADERFDSARIAAAVDALAEKHAGREDVFRSSVAQLFKLLTALDAHVVGSNPSQ